MSLCFSCFFFSFFFFKQKTAYVMRISDWSSDVCSSDLWTALQNIASGPIEKRTLTVLTGLIQDQTVKDALTPYTLDGPHGYLLDSERDTLSTGSNWQARSERRRVGKECLSPYRSRW